MSEQPVKAAADKVASGTQKDWTGRAVNGERSPSQSRADKMRDPPKPVAETATDAIADAAERAAHPPLNR